MGERLNFEAKDTTLQTILFSEHLRFRVPRFQRPYAWSEDQVSDLWNDLTNPDSNFFGSLIFNNKPYNRHGYFEIIDGQQRLLTITILCAVIRDIANKIDVPVAERFQRKDIAFEDRRGRLSYRIECGESIKEFFEKNIQEKGADIANANTKAKEEKLIKNNYLYLRNKVLAELKRYPENSKKLEYLESLRDSVATIPVIKIEIGSEEDAYEIFETTNARGIDLSVADLLKNMIFSKMEGTEEKDIAKELWSEIVTNIQETGDELKRFIRYHWIATNPLVSEKKLYRTIKNKTTDSEHLLMSLHNASQIYNKLLAGNKETFDELSSGHTIFKSLNALRIMNVTQCYVLFLGILKNYEKLGENPKRIFQWVENFSFKYSAICKLPGNRLEKLYSAYARKLDGAVQERNTKNRTKGVQTLFEDLKKDLLKEVPGKEQFREAFSEVAYKNSEKQRKLIKYILYKINSHNQAPELNIDDLNIEHILPRKPSKGWGLSEKDIKRYVNNLGNLTLIDHRLNAKMQNSIIKEKFKELSKSVIYITAELCNHLEKNGCKWNEEEINKRQDRLAQIAYDDIWTIN